MPETRWKQRQTASVTIDVNPDNKIHRRLFCDDDIPDGEMNWTAELWRMDSGSEGFQLYELNLLYSSQMAVWVEEITVALDDSPPCDLLAHDRPELLRFLNYSDRIPGIVGFKENRIITKVICSAVIDAPKDLRKIAIKIAHKAEIEHANVTMVADMKNLFQSEEDADVILSLADGVVKAHRILLKSRVPYFKALFASGMKEAQTNQFHIGDYSVAEFRLLLEFVYAGTITSSFEPPQLATLIKIADQFNMADFMGHCLTHLRLRIQSTDQVQEIVDDCMQVSKEINAPAIREACKEALCCVLANGGVCDPLILAHRYGFSALKSACLQLLKRGGVCFEAVKERLKAEPDVMMEVIEFVCE